MRFAHNHDGTIVTLRRAHVSNHDARTGCARVHVTHNFFIGRVATLRKLGWDACSGALDVGRGAVAFASFVVGAMVLVAG